MSNALMTVPKDIEKASFDVAIRSDFFTDLIGRVLSDAGDRERFTQDLIISVNNDPSLLRCEKLSLVSGGLQAKQYNLRIGDASGHAYLVPYNDRKTGLTKAQFQIGYKGLIQLALRSGRYLKINVVDVREGELKAIDYLMEEHEFAWLMPNERKDKPIIGYAAVVVEKSGFNKVLYVTKEEVEAHAGKYSQAYRNSTGSPWSTEFDKMAKKTVLKLLLGTYGHVTPELEAVIEADQAVIAYDEDGNPVYSYVDGEETKFNKNKGTTGKQAFIEAQAEEEPKPETAEVKEQTIPKPKAEEPKVEVPKAETSKDDEEEVTLSESSKDKLAALKAKHKRGRPPKEATTETVSKAKPETPAPTAKVEVPEPKVITKTTAPKSTVSTPTEVPKSHAEKLAALRARWKSE